MVFQGFIFLRQEGHQIGQFMETQDNQKLQMGGEGGKKEAIYEGSSGNTRSSQLHCHDPETLRSYPEAFSHTELWVGSWGAETYNYSSS